MGCHISYMSELYSVFLISILFTLRESRECPSPSLPRVRSSTLRLHPWTSWIWRILNFRSIRVIQKDIIYNIEKQETAWWSHGNVKVAPNLVRCWNSSWEIRANFEPWNFEPEELPKHEKRAFTETVARVFYKGMLPCFFQGSSTVLPASLLNDAVRMDRTSRGSIISSTQPVAPAWKGKLPIVFENSASLFL